MQSRGWYGLALLASLVLSTGCGEPAEDPGPFYIPEGCNPLASEWDCLLPYPSDFFRVDDPSLPSGKRVRLTERAIVRSKDDLPGDPTSVHALDGFSPISQIVALFPQGVDRSGLVFHTGDVFASLAPSSPTLLIEADSGLPVLHFAETDPRAVSDDRRAFLLRPMQRLRNGARYIVAIHGLGDPAGKPVIPPEGFRRIRDRQASGHEILGPIASRFEEEIFPVLEDFGLERADLQLAWDFTTETEENSTADMLAVRAKTIEIFSASPPAVTITGVEDDYGEFLARRVDGTMRVPLFLESPEPASRLHRDGQGRVVPNGETDVPFTVLIPRSVAQSAPDDPPARLLQYGHGFFGFRAKDSETGHIDDFLDAGRFVYVAADWWGMSSQDVGMVMDAVMSRPSEVLLFAERAHQGMANFIALGYAAKGPLLQQPELRIGPEPLYDPDHVYFYGLSQGGILGGTFVALSPHVERAVLGVGGAGFTFIMYRSHSFASYLGLIEFAFTDPLDVQKYTMLFQGPFDRIDPITFAPHLVDATYPDGPASRQVLLQVGIGDASVPNLSAHLHARAMGAGHLQPAPQAIPGLEPVDSPCGGAALVEFDFGVDPLPGIEAVPPADTNEVHDGIRELEVARRQIDLFFREDGVIEHTCDGPCDPE